MNGKNYSYVMMDGEQFKKYQKMCQRNKIPCHYSMVNATTYGVMVAENKHENNVERVVKTEVIKDENICD